MPFVHDPRFDPYMTAIGQVATGWAEYEGLLNNLIWNLANVERMAGSCITSQMIGPGPRFRCIVALLHFRSAPEALIKKFNSHHTDAEKLAAQRNRFLHDSLVRNNETGQMARVETTADKRLRHDIVLVEIRGIEKIRDDIGCLIDRLAELCARVAAELPPWPQTQFEQSAGILRQHIKNDDSA
jgi:hypothetical protein